jgi:hypothetical protein
MYASCLFDMHTHPFSFHSLAESLAGSLLYYLPLFSASMLACSAADCAVIRASM